MIRFHVKGKGYIRLSSTHLILLAVPLFISFFAFLTIPNLLWITFWAIFALSLILYPLLKAFRASWIIGSMIISIILLVGYTFALFS